MTTFVAASFSTGKEGVQLNNCAHENETPDENNRRIIIFFIASR
jgi:hypothetical protein